MRFSSCPSPCWPGQLMTRGYDPAPMTPEAFGKYLQQEVARWAKAIKQYGIKSIE